MGKGGKGGGEGGGSSSTSDVQRRRAWGTAAALTGAILILLAVLYFAVFRPRDPKMEVLTMQLLSLKKEGGGGAKRPTSSGAVANLSLLVHVSLYNPNKADFVVQDGGMACLYYDYDYGSRQVVGYAELPPGVVPADSSADLALTLALQGGAAPLRLFHSDSILQLSLFVNVVGKVTALSIFTHHTDVVSKCGVNVSLEPQGIMAYTCRRSYSVDL